MHHTLADQRNAIRGQQRDRRAPGEPVHDLRVPLAHRLLGFNFDGRTSVSGRHPLCHFADIACSLFFERRVWFSMELSWGAGRSQSLSRLFVLTS